MLRPTSPAEPAPTVALSDSQANVCVDPTATVGEYEIQGPLGRGGMGVVYRAVHRKLKRQAAIKFLPAERQNDPRYRTRFLREMEALGQLDHPNLVRAYDAGEHQGSYYLAMELIEGEDLATVLKHHNSLRVPDACEIVRQAASGLAHAWQRGLVHRDLKPSNILLGCDGIARIVDLGLAQFQTDGQSQTQSGDVLGTFDYMAPEQARRPHDVDIRADIYSLGCTLFHFLTGSTVFPSSRFHSITAKLLAHASDPIPDARELRHELSDELLMVLNAMLSKSPADRIQTPSLLEDALSPFCAGHNLRAIVEVPVRPVIDDQSTDRSAIPTRIERKLPRWKDRPHFTRLPSHWPKSRWWLAFVALGLVIGLGSYMVYIRQSPRHPNSLVATPAFSRATMQYPGFEDTGHDRYDETRDAIFVHSDEPRLIQLGELSGQPCQISAAIQQMPWTGEVGLFFGYRERDDANWGRVAHFHLVKLGVFGDAAEIRYYDGSIDPQTKNYAGTHLAEQLPTQPVRGQRPKMSVVIGQAGIDRISFGSQNLTTLVARLRNASLAGVDTLDGPWGIYCSGGSVWFSNFSTSDSDR